ncbi:MAG: tRNA (adenosine(37)-N6)-threonylcarbamoyltransferase complex ATPase subunit type 1 TsaE, partial [Parcubacteria group bacterium]|nr:tRNA (adenosine(37)-N6)-threonylcarbamoyltransferase complex ATPase subunit type 1 TsaE [Parcubacteria group bacterium]
KDLRFKNIYHIDAYRLKSASELGTLHFSEIIGDPRNVVLVEWADKVRKILPKTAIWIKFRHGRKENERYISLT